MGNKIFSEWIDEHGEKGNCDFDPSHGNKNRVILVDDFSEHIDEYFRSHYGRGDEYVYATEDSDNMQYSTYGEPYQEILSDDLQCDEEVLNAIIEKFPDADYIDIKDGGEAFYDDFASYESIDAAAKRDLDAMDYYYELEASLSNPNSLDTLHRSLESMKQLLEEKDLMNANLHKFQLMMVFGFCITSLEAYLWHVFTTKVLKDEALKKKYIKSDGQLNSFKKTASQIYLQKDKISELMNEIEEHVKNTLQEKSFHNITQTVKLYKDVFGLDLTSLSQFDMLIKKRHDFIHRGGKSKDGSEVLTSKSEVENLINDIKVFCNNLDVQIIDMESSKPF